MRKTKKSSMYDIFQPPNEDIVLENCVNIVDGGFLLHRVIWKQNSTYSTICASYINCIQRHYGQNCTVVFDGTNVPSRIRLAGQSNHIISLVLLEKTLCT